MAPLKQIENKKILQIAGAPEDGALVAAYKRMLYLRVAEEQLVKMYLEKKLFSMVHFYIGEEAVAVGVCDALRPEDKVLGNHRSHGHYLAKGGNFRRMVCELLGRANGLAHGKGGSMHMIDKSVNFVGSTPLLGSVAPLVTGIAFEQKYNKKDDITVGFYGDGASEEGAVYESYNLAALYEVPVLFVIENNLFAINSKLRDRRAPGYNLEKILSGFGVRYLQANGNDYEDVHAKARELVDYIRREKRPAVLEARVYRHMAHSTPLMDEKHRDEDTAEMRAQEDPIARLKHKLLAAGTLESDLLEIESIMRKDVQEDIVFAETSPFPDKSEMFTDQYYE